MNTSELYKKEIIEALKEGHAAVMVGAGFSRNAINCNGSDSVMPDWKELESIFAERINLSLEEAKDLGALKMAQKVEAYLGRPVLDRILLDNISDERKYIPSNTHETLMRLPWTDVFTTNYDCLLERAAERVFERKYSVVHNANDLLYSAGQARIIKLHGSFPSARPFIITENDYNEYPKTHAPFVNTVQQSLIENTFILIGFSGDDPNFQNWLRWIYETFGDDYTPKIYMITYEHTDENSRDCFFAHNIEQIVLKDLYPSSLGISSALEKFICEMESSVREWEQHRISWPPEVHNLDSSDPLALEKELKCVHESYPGWIVVPYKRQARVLSILNGAFVFSINRSLKKLIEEKEVSHEKIEIFLSILYEYSWLHWIIGCPFRKYELDMLRQAYDFFEKTNDSSDNRLFRVSQQLLLSYRVYGQFESWNSLFTTANPKYSHEVHNKLQLDIENTYYRIYILEWNEAVNSLTNIKADTACPELMLELSGLWALLGKYDKALDILRETIADVRMVLVNNRDYNVGIRYRSYESCLVDLYSFVKQAQNASKGIYSFASQEKDRTETEGIKDYNTDYIWRIEYDRYTALLGDDYIYSADSTINYGFAIGSRGRTEHFGDSTDLHLSYSYIGFRERTGHPFRLGMVSCFDGSVGLVKRLSYHNVYLSILITVLCASDKITKKTLGRYAFSIINREDADKWMDALFNLLDNAISTMISASRGIYAGDILYWVPNTIIELMSRLVTRCSVNKYHDLILLMKEVYEENTLHSRIKVQPLLKQVIACMDSCDLKDNLEQFWEYAIIPDDAHNNINFPDPFSILEPRIREFHYGFDFEPDEEQNRLQDEWLIELDKSVSIKEKNVSVFKRLMYLHLMGYLNDKQHELFCQILWKADNLNSYGIPDINPFYYSVLDDLTSRDKRADLVEALDRVITDKINHIRSDTWLSDDTGTIYHIIALIESFSELNKNDLLYIHMIAEYCVSQDTKETGVVFNNAHVVNNLLHMDGLIGRMLLAITKSNRTISKEVSMDVNMIIGILDKYNLPHTLITWCIASDDRRDRALLDTAFSTKRDCTSNANEAMVAIFNRSDNIISDEFVDYIAKAFYTSSSFEISEVVKGLEYLVRKRMLLKDLCTMILDSMDKYASLTLLVPEDDDYTVSKKVFMRTCVFNLAYSIEQTYKELAGHEILSYFRNRAISGDEFTDVCAAWEKRNM